MFPPLSGSLSVQGRARFRDRAQRVSLRQALDFTLRHLQARIDALVMMMAVALTTLRIGGSPRDPAAFHVLGVRGHKAGKPARITPRDLCRVVNPRRQAAAGYGLTSHCRGTLHSPYLNQPLLPLAVALPRMLEKIEADLGDETGGQPRRGASANERS
jgi:hypothetical protein